MTLNLSEIETRLKLVEWEHAQREEITEQLENAYQSLAASIKAQIEKLPFDEVENAGNDDGDLCKLADDLMNSWKEVQSQIAVGKAEQSLSEIAKIPQLKDGIHSKLQDVWPALREEGVLGPSMHELPTVVQFPKLNIDSFRYTPSENFIRRILVRARRELMDLLTNERTCLILRVQAIAEQQVFAYGQPIGEPCFLNKLQAAVLKAAANHLRKSN